MAIQEKIYISNAGLVLMSPYLPKLFSQLDLVEGGEFVDSIASQRAVYLLQYAATGGIDAPEHELVLNKLLAQQKILTS